MSTMQFWKPGATAPGSTLDRATQAEDNIIHSAPASSNLGIQAQRERLPIFKHREKILYAVEKYGVVIIVGQTGCGKTTQLPQYLYEAGWAANGNVIACTQPRRVAATSVAARVATEVGTVLGDEPGQGDILVFLTGREEIDRCLSELSELVPRLPRGAPELVPLPLHAGLSTDDQLAVFQPAERGTRKVVVSTNIAEASVTIDGIRFVVDCGFVKIRTFNPANSLSSLSIVPTSQASATQRSGRAGRTAPGICYRLYPEPAFKTLPKATPPEITRTDLTTPLLQLKSLGIDDLMRFEWLSPPPSESLLRALEGLIRAGMIDQDGALTLVGAKVAECPVEVTIARMLFSSKEYKCGQEILTIAAMTAVQDAFIIPEGAAGALAELERRKFTAEEGDHLTLLNAYNAFVRYGQSASWCRNHALNFRALARAVSIRSQLKKYMTRFGLPLESCEGDAVRLRRCLVSGYWRNGARWSADGTYRSVRGDTVLHVHPNSVMFTRKPRTGWVVYHEMEETKKTQIRILTEIEPDWLLEYGHKYTDKRSV
ncbi:hypothetical protein FRC11_004361 [Ceratobasidium sp. 423]|nr:hypothetical protein FRC11_004361 [Ceratobasidium sp. 423]